ncbi:unnamed protein product [Allacma fusca]|uniref:Cytochrome P450 n=1 Tax=Allacma fusca TaxID=39272 RepID=A0A8J2JFK9_9HEXA|nr:unnamed protein product [Allacma fusca]
MLILGMILVGIASFVLFIFLKKRRRDIKLPPAAWNTPLIGCLPVVVSKNVAEEMFKIGKQLGPVVSTHLGFKKLVIVNGPEAIKEAFRNSSIAGRADVLYKQFLGGKGLIWPDDVKDIRKFIFKCSRHFEFTGNATESIIHEQITLLLKDFEKHNGEYFRVNKTFNIPMVNAIFNLLLGAKIPHDDPDFQYVVKRINMIATLPDPFMRACVLYPPLLKWVPTFLSGEEKAKGYFNDGLSLVQKYLDILLATRVPNQPRCFADALQDKIDETTNETSVFHFEQKSDTTIIFDILVAAIDSTASTLEWIVLYLSQLPQIQKKVQAEIDKIFDILPEKKLNNFGGSMAITWHCVDFKAKFVPRIQNRERT